MSFQTFKHGIGRRRSVRSGVLRSMLFAPCAFAGRLGLTAWRRKSTILIAVLLLVLIIFGVHYNVGYGGNSVNDDFPLKESLVSARNDLDNSPHTNEAITKRKNLITDTEANGGVHFVRNDAVKDNREPHQKIEVVPVLSDKLVQELEQPSRDDIAARRSDAEISYDLDTNNQGLSAINQDTKDPYIPTKRVVHLDLKGAPPKISYLKRLFPLLKTLGATSLLVEYEDMFPFSGVLADITAHNAYTREQVLEILKAASDNGLEVIPLVQTFGHLEFALKREGFVHLREVPESPQALCPSLNQSMDFIETMINQVLELHGPTIRHLHVGCDEVFQMGECSRCRRALESNSGSSSSGSGQGGGARDALFLRHVRAVTAIVAKKWPKVRPILWDDMLRHVPRRDMMDAGIGSTIDPMVWVYAEDVYRFVPTHVWDKYASVFSTVWGASAFKGAFGETQYVPNAKRHLENNLRWLEVMAQEGPKFKRGFAGIVLTGWQRYDHFAVLCELLPASIPSLAISLAATTHGRYNAEAAEEAGAALGCPAAAARSRPPPTRSAHLSLDTDPHMWDKFGRCLFPGNSFFKLTYRLHVAEAEVKEYLDQTTRQRGWMTPYNVRRNYSAPLRITELTGDLSRLQRSMSSLARAAADSLSDYCDAYTVAEWVEQRIYPDILALERVQMDAQVLLSRKTWDRRPLPALEELKRLGVPMPDKNRN